MLHFPTPFSNFLVVNGKAYVILKSVGGVPADLKPALEDKLQPMRQWYMPEALKLVSRAANLGAG